MPVDPAYLVQPAYSPTYHEGATAPGAALLDFTYTVVDMLAPGYGTSVLAGIFIVAGNTYSRTTSRRTQDKGDNNYRVYSVYPHFKRRKYFPK